jgi:hypothetical protein
VQGILRHADPRLRMAVYAHDDDEVKRDALERYERRVENAPVIQ